MPSPVAHTLAGCCFAAAGARHVDRRRLPVLLGALVVAANIPDVDFLFAPLGWRTPQTAHQGFTHSIGFVLPAIAVIGLLAREKARPLAAFGLVALAGASHLLLDLFSSDPFPPVGFPLFWPFDAGRWHAGVNLFPGTERSSLFNRQNWLELAVELAWLLPPLVLLLRHRAREAAR
jgi:membrane-bound metal-dependent hydrolase YbcI (DUF457 family)